MIVWSFLRQMDGLVTSKTCLILSKIDRQDQSLPRPIRFFSRQLDRTVTTGTCPIFLEANRHNNHFWDMSDLFEMDGQELTLLRPYVPLWRGTTFLVLLVSLRKDKASPVFFEGTRCLHSSLIISKGAGHLSVPFIPSCSLNLLEKDETVREWLLQTFICQRSLLAQKKHRRKQKSFPQCQKSTFVDASKTSVKVAYVSSISIFVVTKVLVMQDFPFGVCVSFLRPYNTLSLLDLICFLRKL